MYINTFVREYGMMIFLKQDLRTLLANEVKNKLETDITKALNFIRISLSSKKISMFLYEPYFHQRADKIECKRY